MLIIVTGLPGSGKTYLATKLSRELGAEYVCSDQIRKAMDARGRYAFADKLSVYEEMAHKAGQSLRRGKSVVVDATFYRQEMREIFNTLGTLLHKPVCYIQVEADEELIRDRLRTPRKDSEAGYAVYQQLKPQYEKLLEPHTILHSSNDNIQAILQQALEYVKSVQPVNK